VQNEPIVYVVPAIDTEGPVCDPSRTDLLDNWEKVERAFVEVADPKWRYANADSFGGPACLTWFLLDWVGFKTNPRGRDLGHHKVFDRYRSWISRTPWADELGWHYHHVPVSGIGNEWNTNWNTWSPDLKQPPYDDILAHKLIERNWFPTAYRAGGTIQSNDSSTWLETSIFADYSQRAPVLFMEGGAQIDWARSPLTARPYHPDAADYQGVGKMNRWLVRSVDAISAAGASTKPVFKQEDARLAFDEAVKHGSAIASFFVHDYRPMAEEFSRCFACIRKEAESRKMKWQNIGATAAVESSANLLGDTPRLTWNGRELSSNVDSFCETPFAAIKDRGGIRRIKLKKTGDRSWRPAEICANALFAAALVSSTGRRALGQWQIA
jgi:hypothetical protein